ncbi:MAG: type IV pilin protein [Patescibacteria group bacterium]
MRPFSKVELFWVLTILIAISLASLANFRVSLRRSRDVERKAGLRDVYNALESYQKDFGFFPLASEGKIVACKGVDTKIDAKGNIVGLVPCEWGKDSLVDVFDASFPSYLKTLPDDPFAAKGLTYVYFSSGTRFQIYASLEGEDEPEYDPKIVARSVSCGVRLCNFGLAYGNTPLDKSIEEYENEMYGD